ncbi:MAG TPA: hydantoinase/oxoprolinase family protein [Pirellulales bacterium]|nr:hydantoinase/oxoprolinase family protein [Pirellulales bacterium]
MNVLAFDIGGANLKAADGCGFSASRPFPLWQRPADLADALSALVADAPPAEMIVATMTGELADCFETKAQGVAHILAAVQRCAADRPVRVYLVDGSFVSTDAANQRPLLAAASNWHVLARFAARFCEQNVGLLIDVGSTTTDLIPIVAGCPAATGTNDTQRLAASELIYTGVTRSPVCAVVDALPYRGQKVPVAQELFATTRDAYLLLGDMPEDASDCQTADGRPATRAAARDRLARMICADREMFGDDDASAAAAAVGHGQLSKLGIAARGVLRRLPGPPATVVISGQGEFVARRLCERLQLTVPIVSLAAELGPAVSCAAPAHALAVIARETL